MSEMARQLQLLAAGEDGGLDVRALAGITIWRRASMALWSSAPRSP